MIIIPIQPVKLRRIYYAKIKITGEVKLHNPRFQKSVFQTDFLIGDFWKINVSIIIARATIFSVFHGLVNFMYSASR